VYDGVNKERDISFDNSGDFLNWWFDTRPLKGKALEVFERYYSNYRSDFNGYLKGAWTDRHLELDKEIDAMQNKSNIKIMDLGCGTGSVSLYIAGKLQGKCEVVGVDINGERLFCARERQKVLERSIGLKLGCEFIESDVLSLDNNPRFDLVYLEETLHHLEPRSKVIKKISGLLKSGGILIISEVNAYNPFMQVHLFKRRGLRTVKRKIGKNGQAIMYGVERILPASKVVRLFTAHNLKVRSLRYFRIASAKLGSFLEKRDIDVLDVERKICKTPFLNTLFSVHYNIVLGK
jgi:ubiquinone/menaquinone biosynthesis C-methylase UbiE